ncbi:hypothetical protein dqs_3459 [Azoarcus olearius]|uniref:translocation/assembly module TamB domain-containing protein n=1 Tax=Azoarcus sp. (strain BH72) TaxID=418699 RepID=UPI0008060B81|nr:translocation/assembly module TamB domain-containing protein [Azoarcus olearius]ANQ86480.1 hypothetical protein dqs_3459 [Azoarcus olearius]
MDGPDDSANAPPAPPAPAPPRARRRRWPLLLAAALLGLLAALAWSVSTEAGLQAVGRLASRIAPGELRIEQAGGRLLGPLRIGRLSFVSPSTELTVDDFVLEWTPAELLHGRLEIQRIAARSVALRQRPGPPDGTPPTPPASLALPVELSVSHIEIDALRLQQGEDATSAIVLNTLRGGFAADAEALVLRDFSVASTFGDLRAEARIAAVAPFALSARASLDGQHAGQLFQATVDADGTLFATRLQASLHGNAATGSVTLEATPFEDLPLRGVRLRLEGVDPALFVAAAPSARLTVEAELGAQASPAGALILSGPLRLANAAPAPLNRGGIPLRGVAGVLQWSGDEGALEQLAIELAGRARATGRLGWTQQVGAEGLQFELGLSELDLHAMDDRLPAHRLSGDLRGEAGPTRQHARVALRLGGARIEAEGAREVAATGDGSTVTGKALVRDFDPAALFPGAPGGRINLQLDVDGQLAAQNALALRFELPEGRLQGRPVRGKGRLDVVQAPGLLRLEDVAVALDLAGNRIDADGAWGAGKDRLRFVIDAPALDALGYGFGGRMGAAGELTGGAQGAAGEFQLFASALTLPGAMRIDGANASGRLSAGPKGTLVLAAGFSGIGQRGARDNQIDVLRIAVDGRVDAHTVAAEAEGVSGHRVDIGLDGGWNGTTTPGRWVGRLVRLQTEGRFPLRLRAPAALDLGSEQVRLGTAELTAGEAGRIRLDETRWSPASSAFRGSLTGLALGLTTRRDGTPRRGPGPLVLGAEWDLRLADSVEGEARVFRESGDLSVEGEIPTRLGLDGFELRLAARGTRLSGSLAASGAELGELSGSATAALKRAGGVWTVDMDAPLLGSARLAMPSIAWFGRLLQERVETGGRLDGEFTLAGTPAAPYASGRIRGQTLRLALVDQGLILAGGELLADFDRERLRIERLSFISPNRVNPRDNRIPVAALTATPGRLDAQGEIALASGEGAFRFTADRLPLLQRPDRWLILSGRGEAHSTWTSLALDAALRADAGYVEIADTPPPALSDDVVILGREQPAGTPFAISADIRIGLGDALYLSALGVETRLAGAFSLRQRPGQALAAVGTVNTVGGTYKGYGQRLEIERGLVSFQGPVDDPGLNIVALRKGLAVEAGVAITGSARRPQVRLVSEPSVPDPEKLSWIVLGRAPDAAGGADLALLLPAAQALLGGPGGGMTEQLSRSLGFDTFSIGQGELNSSSRTATSKVAGAGTTIASDPTVAGQVLSVGKRLSTDLFLSFEQSLGGAESLVKLTYQLGRRVSVVARGGTDNALDLYYTFAFR